MARLLNTNFEHLGGSLLDPLLDRLARKYVDDADLSSRLKNLYKVRNPHADTVYFAE